MDQAAHNPSERSQAGIPPRPGRVLLCLVLLISLTFAVDVSSSGVALGGLYAIPILVSLWLRSSRALLMVTALCCGLTLLELPFVDRSILGDATHSAERFRSLVANHLVQVASLLFVCLIGHWRLRDERDLEDSRDTNATTLASIAEGVITTDVDGRVTYMNQIAERLSGTTAASSIGRPLAEVLVLGAEQARQAPIEDLPGGVPAVAHSRARLTARDGREVPIEKVQSALRGQGGARRGDVIVFRDITDRERLERDMRTLAYRDTLTQLPNRLSLHELLALELAHARRNRGGLGVLFVDLDEFKQVNDRFGHAAGDEVLRQTAARLRTNLREADTIARLGGDEFAVLLPGAADSADAERVARKLLDALDEPIRCDGQELRVRASIGIALYPGDGATPDDLLRRADEAMYQAKQRGGARLATSDAAAR